MYIQSVFTAILYIVSSNAPLKNQIKDVASLVCVIYDGYDVSGNIVRRIITKRVESVLLNGLRHEGEFEFFLDSITSVSL